ncbi:TetR/AcrR family transcriptional regulator [Micromonospora phaseoli]|uniref:TetR/AcrR family transcriptional regulator n=1 Tax=Micromonospora phaseoli TaxID=1144548 RepID=UPI00194E1F2F|nr:TetR/AcrR family transcriptional regulator [Micromonospora phaseoli]GIJ77332.1 TetR family transcriptional regulator [Micromonospora phaseoli]
MTGTRGYHHGDLRRALLDVAVTAIEESGPAALSLRELARRAGVSHAAPAHHFGDRAGLFTALAVQGFDSLAEALDGAGGELLDLGVAYVDFAVRHRAHFEVMFQPDLYRADAAEVRAARERAGAALRAGVATLPALPAQPTLPESRPGTAAHPGTADRSADGADRPRDAADRPRDAADRPRDAADRPGGLDGPQGDVLAAWSIVHGFATLWLAGALPAGVGDDPGEAARTVIRRVFIPAPDPN